VQNVSGELIVSGLDSATSLIQAGLATKKPTQKNHLKNPLKMIFLVFFIYFLFFMKIIQNFLSETNFL
jgi:hypothetical protein